MTPARTLAVAAALWLAVAAVGCGLGAGAAGEGEATLTVTRDYGAEQVIEATIERPAASDTVMRALDREAEITTRYGGGFVQSIEGLAGARVEGRSFDWFFYVNGVESPVGAADAAVESGDRIWWDYRDWTDVMRVPAVIGSFPQPFEDAGGRIEIGCATAGAACEVARAALEGEGVEAEVVALSETASGERPRLLVGVLDLVLDDQVAGLLRDGPGSSGVFARPVASGGDVELLDERERVRRTAEAGLVAATARDGEAPTWVVTGADADLVAGAAGLLGAGPLGNRFAVAITRDGETIPLPVR